MTTDFRFAHSRAVLAATVEAAPAVTAATVWNLEPGLRVPTKTRTDALLIAAYGANATYELGYWNTDIAVPAWQIVTTGVLVNGVPQLVWFPYDGARIYLIKTAAALADVVLACTPTTGAGEETQLAAAGATLALIDGDLRDVITAARRPTIVITRNGDGTINTFARTFGGATVTRTYSYVGGLCTGWTEA